MAFLPESLKLFLSTLINGTKMAQKQAFLGQAIMQPVRPKVFMAPLQIMLGVQLYHLYHSKFLVDILHKLGVVSSYSAMKNLEKNASLDHDTLLQQFNDGFVQYVAHSMVRARFMVWG